MEATECSQEEWRQLIRSACLPAAEMIGPIAHRAAQWGFERRPLDWVTLGRLLRARLGWWDYPDKPPEDPGEAT
jgi:hypothetical protein